MCAVCNVCVCVKVCRGVGESRLSCGFIRNCYRRACCIRSELCCTQSSIFISAARGWFYWVSADPLALQPIRPVCPPRSPSVSSLLLRMRFYFSLSPATADAATAACLPALWLLPFAIFHFAAYILHRWRWRLCRECFVICGIKNVAILLQPAVSLSLLLSRSKRGSNCCG